MKRRRKNKGKYYLSLFKMTRLIVKEVETNSSLKKTGFMMKH